MEFGTTRPRARAILTCALLALGVAVRASDTARLPDPSYPSVVRLLDANKPVDALAELDRQIRGQETDPPLDAMVLRAELLGRTGRLRDAAAFWNEVARREPTLAALAVRKAVEALIAAGDVSAALERLGEPSIRLPARRQNDLRLAAAGALRSTGEPRRGADLAAKILRVERTGALADAAVLELAASLEAAGDVPGASEALRRAQRGFSDARTFTRARDEERRLAGTFGRKPKPFTEIEYRAVANRLAGQSRFAESNDVLLAWRRAHPNSPNLDDIDAAIIDNLYRLRANGEARAAIEAFVARYPSSLQLPRARVIEFRLDVREGRTAEVKAHGRTLWQGESGALPSAARRTVGVTLANYLVSAGDPAEGLALYRALYRLSARRADRVDILLRAGAAAIRAGDPKRAEGNLRSILALKPGSSTLTAAMYWLAIAEDQLGRRANAIARLQDVVDRAPFGFYGAHADQRLRALGATPRPARSLAFPDASLLAATERLGQYRAATILARAGLLRDAAAAARDLASRATRDPAATLLAARASDVAGEHRAALRMLTGRLSPHLQRPSEGAPADLLTLAYPRAFWDEVRARAEEHQIDPLLLLAIMRRESRFDPGVVSAAGAIGLFQIMSYTAEGLAPEAGVETTDEDAILHPPANTAIAAKLVSNLSKLFGGASVPVIASFNAGEDRVKVWWDAARGLPEDLFVETIPYAETRAYVKEVYANYLMYRKLYGQRQ